MTAKTFATIAATIAATTLCAPSFAQLVYTENFNGLTLTTCPGQTASGNYDDTQSSNSWGIFTGADANPCTDTVGLSTALPGYGGAPKSFTWSDAQTTNVGNNAPFAGSLGTADYWFAFAFQFNGTPSALGSYIQMPNFSDSAFSNMFNLTWFNGLPGGLQVAGSTTGAANGITAETFPAPSPIVEGFVNDGLWHLLVVRQRCSTTGATALFQAWVDPTGASPLPAVEKTAFDNFQANPIDNNNYAITTFLPSANADHLWTMTISKLTFWNAAATTLADVKAAYPGTAAVADWSTY